MTKIKGLLLDLDGTLLNVDMREFLPAYIRSLIPWISDYIPPAEFPQMLMASTGVMVADINPALTNEQVFFQDFCRRAGHPEQVMKPVFDDYYQKGFLRLRHFVNASDGTHQLLQTARAAGLQLVLATNPVFPKTAILQRMAWGGIEPGQFALITSLENMHFCKPRQQYYQEILAAIDLQPGECLMAGNDVGEDILPTKALGMKTFLVDSPLLINETSQEPNPDARGSLTDLAEMLA